MSAKQVITWMFNLLLEIDCIHDNVKHFCLKYSNMCLSISTKRTIKTVEAKKEIGIELVSIHYR